VILSPVLSHQVAIRVDEDAQYTVCTILVLAAILAELDLMVPIVLGCWHKPAIVDGGWHVDDLAGDVVEQLRPGQLPPIVVANREPKLTIFERAEDISVGETLLHCVKQTRELSLNKGRLLH